MTEAANDERANIGTTMQTVRLLERALRAVRTRRGRFTADEMVELRAIEKLLSRVEPGTDRINEWML